MKFVLSAVECFNEPVCFKKRRVVVEVHSYSRWLHQDTDDHLQQSKVRRGILENTPPETMVVVVLQRLEGIHVQ